MLKKLSDKIGLTAAELKIFLFLLLMLSLGVTYKYYKKVDVPQRVVFDYHVKDSLFNSALNTNVNTRYDSFDYKREVLDFNEGEFEHVKVEKTTAEKSVNLNKAAVNDLISVPGLGEKTALKIVEYRNKNGPFENLEELLDIKGIGEKKFNKIRNYVYIE